MAATPVRLLLLVLSPLACVVRAADTVPTGPLPRTVVPTLVALELKIDPRKDRFSGYTRIEAEVASATDVVWMHANGLEIGRAEAVLADGRRLPLEAEIVHVSGVLKLTAPEPLPVGTVTLELDHEAPFGALEGAYRARQADLDYVVTQMEPLGARRTFPGFDEPAFKQPWEITLVVPRADVAVANTAETRSEDFGESWKRVRFARTEALPSYLIAFAVGPWDVVAGPDIAAHGDRIQPVPFRTLAAKGQGDRLAYGRAGMQPIVHALEDYFGTPYPFDKLDNVAAPDFAFGAMENAGLIVYRDAFLFAEEASPVNERLIFWMVSAHELAHQWFGNLVTMRWWDDLWLNEAFANWMGYKIAHQLQPQLNGDRAMLEESLSAMAGDSLDSTRRIGEPIRDFTDIESAIDGITYGKGGAVLGMIEAHVGERSFRDGVRDYLAAHARGNATRDDLIAAIAARSKDPAGIRAAFASFIDQPGIPFVRVELDCSGPTPALELRQQRYLPAGSGASADQSWTLPMCVRYADGEEPRNECGLVQGATARLPLVQARSCPAWVMPNAQAAGYYRYVLPAPLQQALTDAFDALDAREQRVYADSLLAAFRDGSLTPAQYLAALPRLAGAKAQQTVTSPFIDLRWMWENLIDDEADRDAFRNQVADIYRPRLQQLGLAPRPGESEDDRQLREVLVWVFAYRLKDQEVRRALDAQGRAVLGLGGDGQLHVDAVSRDARSNALVIALQEGGAAAFDLAEKHLRASQDPTLRAELLGAMGRVEDPALAARFRTLVLAPDLLRANEVGFVGMQTAVPSLRPVLRDWVRENFEALQARVGPRIGMVAVNLESAGMCDTSQASELQSRYAERVRELDGGPLALKQAVESVRLCAALKQAQQGKPLAFPSG